jgi:hypothetical protein
LPAHQSRPQKCPPYDVKRMLVAASFVIAALIGAYLLSPRFLVVLHFSALVRRCAG